MTQTTDQVSSPPVTTVASIPDDVQPSKEADQSSASVVNDDRDVSSQASNTQADESSASAAHDGDFASQAPDTQADETTKDDGYEYCERRYERDHRRWYRSHGPTLTGYLKSAGKSARSLLNWAGVSLTGGLVGAVADWTLGPARPDPTKLLEDLRTAKRIDRARKPGANCTVKPEASSITAYTDDLLSRVSALTAWPDATQELLSKSNMTDIATLETAACYAGKQHTMDRALRLAAARELSQFLGPEELGQSKDSSDSSSDLPYGERAVKIHDKLRSFWLDEASGNTITGSRAATALKLNNLLPHYAPLRDQRKKVIENLEWEKDLGGYVGRGLVFGAASYLPQPLKSVLQIGSVLA